MASIRPRLLARGDALKRWGKSIRPMGFNSATPACAWRRILRVRASVDSLELQFGHACLRVETVTPPATGPVTLAASIRPRLLARGDPCSMSAIERRKRKLQFGHACLRVETPKEITRSMVVEGLQFGHACLRVETSNTPHGWDGLITLQFGHACLRVETGSAGGGGGGGGACFNSATPACAWRRLASQTQQTTHFKSCVSSGC